MKKKLINFRELSEVLNKRELKDLIGGSLQDEECNSPFQSGQSMDCEVQTYCIDYSSGWVGYCGYVEVNQPDEWGNYRKCRCVKGPWG